MQCKCNATLTSTFVWGVMLLLGMLGVQLFVLRKGLDQRVWPPKCKIWLLINKGHMIKAKGRGHVPDLGTILASPSIFLNFCKGPAAGYVSQFF